MHTRRDALKLMTVGLGAFALPTISPSTSAARGMYVGNTMGVDQHDGKLECDIVIDNERVIKLIHVQGDFKDLPTIMGDYAIDHCAIDWYPNLTDAFIFAERFPSHTTLCQWSSNPMNSANRWPRLRMKLWASRSLFLGTGLSGHNKVEHAFAKKGPWIPRERRHSYDDSEALRNIATYIQAHCK